MKLMSYKGAVFSGEVVQHIKGTRKVPLRADNNSVAHHV